MKSTIRVDFKGLEADKGGSFEPVIRVHLNEVDDFTNGDVRDNLLKSLFQSLGGQSSWLKVHYLDPGPGTKRQDIMITPVKWYELNEELELMKERIGSEEKLKPEFLDFLIEKFDHLAFAYSNSDEMKEHFLSGEVTVPVPDLIKYVKEYQEI